MRRISALSPDQLQTINLAQTARNFKPTMVIEESKRSFQPLFDSQISLKKPSTAAANSRRTSHR
jgi:hypothetical protein